MARRALLIGINRYRVPGADLRGCVNDVKNLAAALRELCGFAAKDIATLLDAQATKKNIQTGVQSLLRGAKKGDVLLLHFSGHGSNVPDNDGDEADQRDEILCPYDLDWKAPLSDDWLRRTFDRLPAGVALTLTMDCCHSGSITRAVLPPDAPIVARYLPSPWDLVATESGRKLRGRRVRALVAGTPRSASGAARARSDVAVVDIGEVLITGCRDTQTSADARIGGSYHGAMTYNLVAALRKAKGKISYRALHAAMLEAIARGGFDQVPQLEGRKANLDRQFLAPIE